MKTINRQQQRKALKTGRLGVALAQQARITKSEVVEKYSTAVVEALRAETEMSSEDIKSILTRIESITEAILENYVTFNDMKKAHEEELGIVIKRKA